MNYYVRFQQLGNVYCTVQSVEYSSAQVASASYLPTASSSRLDFIHDIHDTHDPVCTTTISSVLYSSVHGTEAEMKPQQ